MKNMIDNTIGIVLVNYMNYKETIKTVNTFLELKHPNIRIVIVDNNSKNNSFEILRKNLKGKNNIKVIKNSKNYGYGFGNNIGIEYLRKSGINYILISNPDILVDDKDILKKMVGSFDREDIAIVAPRISHLDDSETNPGIFRRPNRKSIMLLKLKYSVPVASKFYYVYRYIKCLMEHFGCLKSNNKPQHNRFLTTLRTEVYSVIGCFFMVSLDFFVNNEIYPVFDENIFLYNEELALAEKIYQNEGKEIVLKNCKIIHLADSSMKLAWGKNYYPKILKHSFKSYGYIFKKYF